MERRCQYAHTHRTQIRLTNVRTETFNGHTTVNTTMESEMQEEEVHPQRLLVRFEGYDIIGPNISLTTSIGLTYRIAVTCQYLRTSRRSGLSSTDGHNGRQHGNYSYPPSERSASWQ